MTTDGEPKLVAAPDFVGAEQRALLDMPTELSPEEHAVALGDAYAKRFAAFGHLAYRQLADAEGSSRAFPLNEVVLHTVSAAPSEYGLDPRDPEALKKLIAESLQQAARLKQIEASLQPGTVVLEIFQHRGDKHLLTPTFDPAYIHLSRDIHLGWTNGSGLSLTRGHFVDLRTRPEFSITAAPSDLLQSTALTADELIALEEKDKPRKEYSSHIIIVGNSAIRTYAQVLDTRANNTEDPSGGQLADRRRYLLSLLKQGAEQGSAEMASIAGDVEADGSVASR